MKLYVGNMPFSTSEEELRALFEEHGEVDSVAIITDRETGRSRGFGFIEMPSEEAANDAIEALHEQVLNGRPLVVNKARPRPERGGGGGRRGGYGGGRDRW